MLRNIVTFIIAISTFFFIYSNLQIVYAEEDENFIFVQDTTIEKSTINNIVPDSTITTALKGKYLLDNHIKGLDIHIETTNGIVTLTGKVSNKTLVERAIEIARNTNGVKEVISNIEIIH